VLPDDVDAFAKRESLGRVACYRGRTLILTGMRHGAAGRETMSAFRGLRSSRYFRREFDRCLSTSVLRAPVPPAPGQIPISRLLVRSEAWRASVERDTAAPLTSINAEPMPLRRIAANLHTAMQMPCRFFGSAWQLLRYKDYGVICLACGAPEEIRTPDPQIRRLLWVIVFKRLFCKTPWFVDAL
jgi:hypothetical protein